MNKVYWGIIAVLFLIIVFLRECGGGKCPTAGTVTVKSDTTYISVHDTIEKMVLVPITKIIEHTPAPVTVTDTVFITDIQHVDTIAILKDYFATRNYSDTNHLEGFGNFIINDAITQNKIKNRQIIYNLKFPTVTNTVAVKARNQVWLGVNVGGSKDFIGIGPQFTLKTSSDKMYHAGVMFTTQSTWFYSIGTDFKIHL